MPSRYKKYIKWCKDCGKKTFADVYCYSCMVKKGLITPQYDSLNEEVEREMLTKDC